MHSLQEEKLALFGTQVQSLRAKGIIPAELYGRDFPNEHLSVPAKDFVKVFKQVGESEVIILKIKGNEEKQSEMNVLINEVTHNSITDEVTHVDFYQVRMDEKIEAEVPIRFTGDSPAVKEKNGIVVRAMQAIEVEALPGDLPHEIEVNLSSLVDLGQSLYVRDIKPIAGVKFLVDPETVMVTVTEPAKEEEVPQGPQSVEEVKVEGAEKKAQKEGEKAEENPKKENPKKEKQSSQ